MNKISGPKINQSVILVTGSSRGIGAETVKILAQQGAHVIVNYREKAKRAQSIADDIISAGGKASIIGADVTDEASVTKMVEEIREKYGKLDVLVLNASGGLEIGKDEDYPMLVNRDSQVNLMEKMLPIMPEGSRVVFVTSHQAHFHGKKPVPAEYEPIAKSKRAGEDAIRAKESLLESKKVSLVIVSGDMIDGTIIVTLLARRNPDAVNSRKELGGKLPTVEEFAQVIADATSEPAEMGHTYYVGGSDYQELLTK